MCFAVRVLEDHPQAGVLIHPTAGGRRSAMVAYAVLRLRGHEPTRAEALVLSYRPKGQQVHPVTLNGAPSAAPSATPAPETLIPLQIATGTLGTPIPVGIGPGAIAITP